MHILHIDTGRGWRGGQQQLLWLLQGLRQRGIHQTLLAPAGSELTRRSQPLGKAEPSGAELDFAQLSRNSAKILSIANVVRVREAMRTADLVHAHDAHGHSLAWAAQKMTRVPVPPLVVARRVTFPIRWLGRIKNKHNSWFIAVSEYVAKQLVASGIPPSRVRVVMDGVKPPAKVPDSSSRAEARRAAGIQAGEFAIGTLSSLSPEKLLSETVELLPTLPENVRFWLGVPAAQVSSNAAEDLRRQATEIGCGNRMQIVPVGPDPSKLLFSLDLFVYLSKSEGLGSAILLAMSYGLPVLASRTGGIPEIVQHGETGYLVDMAQQNWSEQCRAAVLRLMDSDEQRNRFGTTARQFVLDNASNDKMVARTLALYHEIICSGAEEGRQAHC